MAAEGATAVHGSSGSDARAVRGAAVAAGVAPAAAWLVFRYERGIDLMMRPLCSVGIHLAVIGIGAATAVVVTAALLLLAGLGNRHDNGRFSHGAVAWSLSAGVIAGAVCYSAYIMMASQDGVLLNAGCHL